MPNNEEEDFLEEQELPEEQNEDTTMNESEPIEPDNEDPASSLATVAGSVAKEEVKKEIKKKALMFIAKNPYVLIGLGVIVIIFFLILLIAMDFDWVGVGDTRPDLYQNSCDKILLTWENDEYIQKWKKEHSDQNYPKLTDPSLVDLDDTERFSYKEYDYDKYISNIVWKDNNTAGDVDNEIVYEAMAVAARSHLISTMGSNCVVLRDFNPQNFDETIEGTEEKYSEISTAVSNTQGLIIGRNSSIIQAKYDVFTYTKKTMNSKGEDSRYYLYNKNESGEQIVPASWVKKNNVPTTPSITSVKLSSLSIYGAKYLAEKQGAPYDLYRILEYYYGRDLEYYTIDYAFSNSYISGCSDISMKDTPLTKEDFIARVQSYGNSHGGGAKTLADNAAMIYDMGISNSVNPELVYIRAYVEGHSPGDSKNNYWGIGCTNTGGYKACTTYGSLAEGVAGFMKIVSKYATLADLAGKYAYLGDYWYNPGGSGVGGCYYAPYIFKDTGIPERVQQACASGNTCSGSDCVATTEEDRHAYNVYQSQVMVKARKTIFGLDADSCQANTPIGEPGTGSCSIWKQGDSRWGSLNLGYSSETMSRSGCAVTSIAIAMSCSGTQINNVAQFDPGILVQTITKANGFTSGGAIYWDNAGIKNIAPGFSYMENITLSGNDVTKVSTVTGKVNDHTSVLLHFKNEAHPRGHWVVLKSVNGSIFTVYDPGNGSVNTYAAKDLDRLITYTF